MSSAQVIEGDCIEAMRAMPEASVDAVVCDPPYGLEFMGKEWDRLGDVTHANRGTLTNMVNPDGGQKFQTRAPAFDLSASSQRAMQAWHLAWAREALRVLKPGAFLIAFGGDRTFHRLACAAEDAGFEIRPSLAWLHGQGFNKVGYLDKRADDDGARERLRGLGGALRPAFEPILCARKPLDGTLVENAARWGTGGFRVDDCRVEHASEEDRSAATPGGAITSGTRPGMPGSAERVDVSGKRDGGDERGRWPTNVLLDEEAARALDEQSGELTSGTGAFHRATAAGHRGAIYGAESRAEGDPCPEYGDTGGASRFYYCAKASGDDERWFYCKTCAVAGPKSLAEKHESHAAVWHPTVKPVDLMRWLLRLVTPKGGTALDPFAGTGTTGIAARAEALDCILVEREPDYLAILRGRLGQGPRDGQQTMGAAW